MKNEIAVMRLVQQTLFSDCGDFEKLTGASSEEISKRLAILSYGYEARTRSALIEWSRHLLDEVGAAEWNRLGSEYAKSQAPNESQIGSIALGFFKWLSSMPLSDSAQKAVSRDEAFFKCQHLFFDEKNILSDPHGLLQQPISLQKTTIVIDGQGMVISRDRSQFYVHQLTSMWSRVLKKLSGSSVLLESVLHDDVNEDELVNFMVNGIKKKWFRKST